MLQEIKDSEPKNYQSIIKPEEALVSIITNFNLIIHPCFITNCFARGLQRLYCGWKRDDLSAAHENAQRHDNFLVTVDMVKLNHLESGT
jgi:hypothetical protein